MRSVRDLRQSSLSLKAWTKRHKSCILDPFMSSSKSLRIHGFFQIIFPSCSISDEASPTPTPPISPCSLLPPPLSLRFSGTHIFSTRSRCRSFPHYPVLSSLSDVLVPPWASLDAHPDISTNTCPSTLSVPRLQNRCPRLRDHRCIQPRAVGTHLPCRRYRRPMCGLRLGRGGPCNSDSGRGPRGSRRWQDQSQFVDYSGR